MEFDIAGWMSAFSGFVWSTPTAILLTGTGLLFTFMTFGIQFKALTHGFAVVRGKYDNPEDSGNISHFQALCAALSATIGLGNISGVAVAIATGGPGAVFWMWVVGFLGMATKFTTCSLATMYRRQDRYGEFRGGPMYYIEMGLGGEGANSAMRQLAKGLAVLFAILGMCASVGAGNMFQANQVAQITVGFFKRTVDGGVSSGGQFWIQMAVGAILCVLAAAVMLGGIKRIGSVASKLIPTMCVVYVSGAAYVILANAEQIPQLFASIFDSAFSATAGSGAFYGIAIRTAMIQGVRRACFSNEAGLGSAPIAHATAKTNEPIREGVVAAVGPFIDTIVICTMTALVILITGTLTRGPVGAIASIGPVTTVKNSTTFDVQFTVSDSEVAQSGESFFVHRPPESADGIAGHVQFTSSTLEGQLLTASLTYDDTEQGSEDRAADRALLAAGTDVFLFREGVQMTAYAFDQEISGFGTYFMPIAAFFFAFSTIISWGFYGETCTCYLFGERAIKPFKFVFVSMILVGTASMSLGPVLDWSDAMLGLMLVPNLIGTLLLSPIVMRATRDYFRRLSAGEFEEEARRAAEAKRRSGE
jgi:AGCS family alanine or glycine:cation symporter